MRPAVVLFLLALAPLDTPAAQGCVGIDPFEEVCFTIQTGQVNATVFVDGVRAGTTGRRDALDLRFPVGREVLVRAEKDGFEAAELAVLAREGETSRSVLIGPLLPVGGAPWWVWGALSAAVLALGAAAWVAQQRRAPRFDRYRVGAPLGRGGMATVFSARGGGREVALKIMDPTLLGDADLVRKFLKEGEVLQRIAAASPDAPVVRAYDYGRENGDAAGRPYVALEYVPGDTLLRFVREQGRLPVRHVLAVTRQVCEGLAAAHGQGVWHRDVSPDNVLLDGPPRAGQPPAVKLIDFGVAKHEYTQARTLDGSISGKPAYMSPEQCRGEPVDGRSDLYAVGVMLYTLLSGTPPFTHSNPLLVMRLHETADVPPLPASVPEPVRALVGRLLAKDRHERPASAAEVAAHLSALERSN